MSESVTLDFVSAMTEHRQYLHLRCNLPLLLACALDTNEAIYDAIRAHASRYPELKEYAWEVDIPQHEEYVILVS